MSNVWVFGYGSLVSPQSFGETLGRTLDFGTDLFAAELRGFGRRWNYGVMHVTGRRRDQHGAEVEHTLVALGIVPAEGESVNGVVGWVSDDELQALDRRERHYDRADVTAAVVVEHAIEHDAGAGLRSAPIMVYVPRAEAIEHYEASRRRGTAAIERRYWDLVDGAFASLGGDHHERYLRTTPEPDVPVLELVRT
jgi:cation transport regulator ChaC